jgi:hypothetical protein
VARTETLQVRIDDLTRAQLDALARQRSLTEDKRVTPSEVVRDLLDDALAGHPALPRPPGPEPLDHDGFVGRLGFAVEGLSDVLLRREVLSVEDAVQGARVVEANLRRWAWSRSSDEEELASLVDALGELPDQRLAAGYVEGFAAAWDEVLNAVKARALHRLSQLDPQRKEA